MKKIRLIPPMAAFYSSLWAGDQLYIITDNNVVDVFDVDTLQFIGSIPVGAGPDVNFNLMRCMLFS